MQISASIKSKFNDLATTVLTNDSVKQISISSKPNITADAGTEEIKALIEHTDKVAEIHNTLRKGVTIQLFRNGWRVEEINILMNGYTFSMRIIPLF